MLLDKGLLDILPHIHVVTHVNLVEGGEEGVRVLGLLESAGDSLSHPAHLNASLDTGSSDLGGSLLGGLLRGRVASWFGRGLFRGCWGWSRGSCSLGGLRGGSRRGL